jgi:hypothetical protein
MSEFRWKWLDTLEGSDSPASAGARHLGNVIVRHFVKRETDVCWPGLRRVAAIMGTSTDTVSKRFAELDWFGFLESTPQGSGKASVRRLLDVGDRPSTVSPGRTVFPRKSVSPGGTVSPWLESVKSVSPASTHRPSGAYRTTLSTTTRTGKSTRAELLVAAHRSGHVTDRELEQATLARRLIESAEGGQS